MKRLFLALVAPVVMLVGAGCLGGDDGAPTTPKVTTPAAVKSESTEKPAAQPTTSNDGASEASVPAGSITPDGSWVTYTARDGRYGFQYPVKGKYAPAWGAGMIAKNDPQLADGCWQFEGKTTSRKATVQGVETCLSSMVSGAAGAETYTHVWLIPSATGFEKVTFTKKRAYADFEPETYEATLDAVVKTLTTK